MWLINEWVGEDSLLCKDELRYLLDICLDVFLIYLFRCVGWCIFLGVEILVLR